MSSQDHDESEIIKDKKHLMSRIQFGPFLGLLYTLLGSFFITLVGVIVKKMIYISPGQLSLVRNLGNLVWSIPIVVFTGNYLLGPKEHRLNLFFCGLFGTTAFYLTHIAFQLLPLAEVIIITSTAPAVIMIGARLFLKESCGLVSSCVVVLTILGVLIYVRLPELIRNTDGHDSIFKYMIGIASAIGCVLCRAALFLLARKMKAVHFSVLLVYIGFLGFIETACMTAAFSFFEFPHCGWDSLLMMCVAIFGFLGHCFIILAIQSETVGIVSAVRSSLDIVVALIFQVIFFQDYLDTYNYIGAFIVMIGVGVIGLKKWLQQLPDESNFRRRLKFLLL